VSAKSGKPKFSVEDWARKAEPPNRSTCRACRAPTEVREALVALSKLRRAGETFVSMTQVSAMLRERFGVNVSPWSLQGHFANCLKAAWSKVDKAKP
jgi:hypothetical protein